MINLFSQFVQDFSEANRKQKAYVYFRFKTEMPFLYTALSEEQIIILNESIDYFIKEFDAAIFWNKRRVALRNLTNFIDRVTRTQQQK